MTLQEILDANPNQINYCVELDGNTDPALRYRVNSWTDTDVLLQQIDTFNISTLPKTSSGYVIYTPSLANPMQPYENLVSDAMDHFNKTMIHFAAENITMGITQAGKTKEVADYFQDLMRYGLSGSLYEVINEVDALKLAGIPASLSPFVTDARMDVFKADIAEFFVS